MRMFAEITPMSEIALPFVLTTVGDATLQPPVVRERGYLAHHFLWLRRGVGHFCVNRERFDLSEGEGIFMRANVAHSYEGEDFGTAWCTFLMDTSVLDRLGVGDCLRFRVPAHLDRASDRLFRFASGESTLFSRSAAGYTFVMELFESILETDISFSARVRRLLESRYAEPLTLDDIADELDCDRFSLCRAYKRERGITVMEELTDIRIAKAMHLLKYSTEKVESIGKMCGFDSPSYFGKRFREAVGVSPAVYRRE